MKAFNRKLLLELDTLKIESQAGKLGLRVTFDIERDTKPYPNNATISIYNLTRPSFEALASKPEITGRLEAGYEENIQQIFFGSLRRARTTREGTDWVTTCDLGDGEAELAQATISKSWSKGTPIGTVLQDFAAALGLGLGNVAQFLASQTAGGTILTQPLTVSGPVSEELSAFTRSVGLSWSIQDGALQLLDLAMPYAPGTAVLLKPDTGLIGAPRLDVDSDTKKTLCVARSLLQPELVPGSLFVVESEFVNGQFAARKTKHIGDTAGQDWYVDVEGVEI